MNRIISSEDLIVLKGFKRKAKDLATYLGVERKKNIPSIKQKGDLPVAKDKPKQKVSPKKSDSQNLVDEDVSNYFLVGIDLGTSRSSIITEDGQKAMEFSVVGWPRDVISIKVVGKPIVFGEEALKMRESLEINLACADGVVNDASGRGVEAAEELIRHLISLVKIPNRRKVCGVIGVPAKASNHSRNLLLEIGKKCMDHVMLISEPFAVAYDAGKLTSSIVVDIGAGTTDLCAMKGRTPDAESQITMKKGGNYVDHILFEALKTKFPDSSITGHIVKRLKEKYATIQPSKKIIANLRVHGEYQPHDITDEIVFACEAILPYVIDGCKQLLMGFDPDFEEDALQNIILAGGISQIRGLDVALQKALKKFGTTQITVAKDSAYGVAKGALKLGADIPVKFWGQIGDLGVEGR